jgi:threonine/homoserine/homoserine lactone efflux protein
MSGDLGTLSIGAITLGFLHCLFGPDHYIPFIAMSRVGAWSLRKTVVVTVLCGIGHIFSSILLGFIGIAFGLIVYQLGTQYELESDSSLIARLELMRGDVAAWLLLAFGLCYFLWGLLHALRRRSAAARATAEMTESEAEAATRSGSLTPWILFTVFLFGPCEPLIPLIIAPAAEARVAHAIWIALLFGGTTVVTMTAIVVASYRGAALLRFNKAEVYGHALAGFVVSACGIAMLCGL